VESTTVINGITKSTITDAIAAETISDSSSGGAQIEIVSPEIESPTIMML
jgi:hypothetical protein